MKPDVLLKQRLVGWQTGGGAGQVSVVVIVVGNVMVVASVVVVDGWVLEKKKTSKMNMIIIEIALLSLLSYFLT